MASVAATSPPAAYVSDTTPLYPQVVKEILSGNYGQAKRIDTAAKNLEFYRGCFERYSPRSAGDARQDARFVRTSLVMQRAVDSLTDLLYRENPKRALKPPKGDDSAGSEADYLAATNWLEACYRANNMGAKWQEADRFTHISDVAAFQVEPSPDPDCPVRIRLWDASEFYAWPAPDDPTTAVAVAVRDMWDLQKRIRLYTAMSLTEFRTKKLPEEGATSGGTAYYQIGYPRKNPLGLLPFSFFHYREPTSDFWTPGPGNQLRQMNDCTNKRLTDLFDSCVYNLNPTLVIKNAAPGTKPPPAGPGSVWFVEGSKPNISSPQVAPDAAYLQADPSFIDAGWLDLNNGIDHGMEMIGVAPAQIRMTQQSAMSGDAIVAEQIAPVKHAEGRKKVARVAEDDLAKLVLLAGAAHLKAQKADDDADEALVLAVEDYQATAAQLTRVARRPGLTVIWPTFYPRIPGNDANLDDQAKLTTNQTSLVEIVARDGELTDQEARAKLEKLADDKAFAESLFGVAPVAPTVPGGKTAEKDAETEDEGQ